MIFTDVCTPILCLEANGETETREFSFIEKAWNRIITFMKKVWQFFINLFKKIINGIAAILTLNKYKPFDIKEVEILTWDEELDKTHEKLNSIIRIPKPFNKSAKYLHENPDETAIRTSLKYLLEIENELMIYSFLFKGQRISSLDTEHITFLDKKDSIEYFLNLDCNSNLEYERQVCHVYIMKLKNKNSFYKGTVVSIVNQDGLLQEEHPYAAFVNRVTTLVDRVAKFITELKPTIVNNPEKILAGLRKKLLLDLASVSDNYNEDTINMARANINKWGEILTTLLNEELFVYTSAISSVNMMCEDLLRVIDKKK